MQVDSDKYSDDLISVVQTAYSKTPKVSFINTKRDLAEPDWHSIDIDNDPDIDATIFYRNHRSGEPWKGSKIQGIGHDGSRKAIDKVLVELKKLLTKPGYWVEASDALEHVLYKSSVSYIEDESFLQKLFPKSDLKLTGDRRKYIRILTGGKKIKETVFGKPKV